MIQQSIVCHSQCGHSQLDHHGLMSDHHSTAQFWHVILQIICESNQTLQVNHSLINTQDSPQNPRPHNSSRQTHLGLLYACVVPNNFSSQHQQQFIQLGYNNHYSTLQIFVYAEINIFFSLGGTEKSINRARIRESSVNVSPKVYPLSPVTTIPV